MKNWIGEIQEHYLGEMKSKCEFCCSNGRKVVKKLEILKDGINGYGTELVGIKVVWRKRIY